MLPVVWTDAARADLPLANFPHLYPQSQRMPLYREIVAHPNYLIFYRVLTDKIQIEMVAHGRRSFPGTLGEALLDE